MDAKEIIDNVKELINIGEIDKAKDILIQEGYIKGNEEIKSVYSTLISESIELKKEKERSLKYLFDEDVKIRRKSSDYIFKQSLKEYTNNRKEWLGDPRTIDILFNALADKDIKVVINITGALYMISNDGRYLKDLRIYDRFKELLYVNNLDVVNYAALGLTNYSIDDKWDKLMDVLEKQKNLKVAQSVLQNIYIKSSMGTWGEITTERQKELSKRLFEIYNTQKKEAIKCEIKEAIDWMKINLS